MNLEQVATEYVDRMGDLNVARSAASVVHHANMNQIMEDAQRRHMDANHRVLYGEDSGGQGLEKKKRGDDMDLSRKTEIHYHQPPTQQTQQQPPNEGWGKSLAQAGIIGSLLAAGLLGHGYMTSSPAPDKPAVEQTDTTNQLLIDTEEGPNGNSTTGNPATNKPASKPAGSGTK